MASRAICICMLQEFSPVRRHYDAVSEVASTGILPFDAILTQLGGLRPGKKRKEAERSGKRSGKQRKAAESSGKHLPKTRYIGNATGHRSLKCRNPSLRF